MGTIKNTLLNEESQEFDLTDEDIAYIQLFQRAAYETYNYHRMMVTRYLAIMAKDRWNFPDDAQLDFDIDPKAKKIKVTVANPLDKR